VSLDVGPHLRSLRRQPGVASLVLLEVAAAFTIITSLFMTGSWYERGADQQSGLDEENLIFFSSYAPSPATAAAGASALSVGELARRSSSRGAPGPSQGPGLDREGDDAPLADAHADDLRRVRAVPGVEAATPMSNSLLDARWSFPGLFVGHAPGGAGPDARTSTSDGIGWDVYADTDLPQVLRTPFLSGGPPAPAAAAATPDRPAAAILTRCLARRLFGGDTAPPGSTVSSESLPPIPIAGVVGDIAVRMAYLPDYRCGIFLLGGGRHDHEGNLLIRARPGQRDAVIARLGAAFAGDAARRFVQARPFDSTTTLAHQVGHGLVALRMIFGVIVAGVSLLAALAVSSFRVAERKRQIGFRRALGATRADVVLYFLVETSIGAALGSLLGLAATGGLFLFMRRVFPHITFDVHFAALTALALWLTSLLATLVPALRAARVPPSVAARSL